MGSKNELKEIETCYPTCYHFDDIIKTQDFDLDNILIYEKSYGSILVLNISYKTLNDSKPLRIRFDKIGRYIRVYNWTRNLVLFGNGIYDSIYNSIRYLISIKSDIKYIISHNNVTIKVDTFNSLPLDKTNTFRKVMILTKSVWNKDKNIYYYNTFLEKGLCKYKSDRRYF